MARKHNAGNTADYDNDQYAPPSGKTTTGEVKWFSEAKGYGFITRDDGGKDVFCHFTGIAEAEEGGSRNLAEGQRVQFEIVQGEKGPQAANVVVVG